MQLYTSTFISQKDKKGTNINLHFITGKHILYIRRLTLFLLTVEKNTSSSNPRIIEINVKEIFSFQIDITPYHSAYYLILESSMHCIKYLHFHTFYIILIKYAFCLCLRCYSAYILEFSSSKFIQLLYFLHLYFSYKVFINKSCFKYL